MTDAARLAALTPPTRDRYVDLLRVLALGVVVFGHWLMAVVLVAPDGSVRTTNALALLPALQPVTWLLQVMPVFFLVGGFSHATALASVERRGGGCAGFYRSRADRLLRPTAVFVGVWLVLALALELTGRHGGVVPVATRTVAQPLWFVGVYLAVIALAPVMLRLHRRLGRRAAAVPVALAAAVAAVDLARFAYEVRYVAYLNVLFVWVAVHQLGFFYADGRWWRRTGWVLAGGGLAAAVALSAYGPYPVSMVGLPGGRVSNMFPPNLALLAHAVWLTGLALLLRGPVSRWLRRPRVWTAVVAANGLAMTVFLWHLTAMFAVVGLTHVLGVVQPDFGSAAWWLQRPVWVGGFAAVTAVLAAAFRWTDRPREMTVTTPDGRRAALAAAGVVLSCVGVLGLSAVGFGGLLAGRTATLVAVPVTPLLSAALLLAGGLLLSRLFEQGGQLDQALVAAGRTDQTQPDWPALDQAHGQAQRRKPGQRRRRG